MKRFLSLFLSACLVVSSAGLVYADEAHVADTAIETVSEENADVSEQEIVETEDTSEESKEDENTSEDSNTASEEEAETVSDENASEETVSDDTASEETTDENASDSEEEPVEAEDKITEDSLVIEGDDETKTETESDSDKDGFAHSETVDGYKVSLAAAKGVFPDGTSVAVAKASAEDEAKVAEMVSADIDPEYDEIVKTATFDITFTDKDGEEIEPEDGSVKVDISVADEMSDAVALAAEAEDTESVELKVYHITDDAAALVSSVKDLQENGLDGVTFEADEFSSYSLIIITHKKQDTTAPTLYSLTLKNASYTKEVSTAVPEFVADIDDDNSGVDVVEIQLTNSSSSSDKITVKLTYKSSDDRYHGKVAVDDTVKAGSYVTTGISICDKAGNYRIYSTSNLPSKFKKTVKIANLRYYFTPVIKSVSISPSVVYISSASSQAFTVSMRVTDASNAIALGLARFIFTPSNGAATKNFSVFLYNNSGSTSDATLTGATYLNYMNVSAGTISLDSVEFASTRKELVEYQAGTSSLASYKVSVKTIDNTVPTVTAMKFNKDTLNITGNSAKVNLVATVSQSVSGINCIKAILSNGKQQIAVPSFTKVSNTSYQATLTIPASQASGTYKLKYVYISDNGGHSTTYDTSKNTMTSALKNTQFIVANDFSYNIAFNANGGSGSMSKIKNIASGQKVTLTANKFKKSYCFFNGWNTKKDGSGTSYHDEATVKNLTKTSGATVTLYAQWKPYKYTIKFNANGGSGSMTSMTCKVGTKYTLSANKFKKSYCKFVGWNTKKDGSGSEFSNKEQIQNLSKKNGATVTLYAQWE